MPCGKSPHPGGRPEKVVVAEIGCKFCSKPIEVVEAQRLGRYRSTCEHCGTKYFFANTEAFGPTVKLQVVKTEDLLKGEEKPREEAEPQIIDWRRYW